MLSLQIIFTFIYIFREFQELRMVNWSIAHLTLWYHVIRCSRGLARTLHSKYTSSPSLMSWGFNVLPRDRVTNGLSGNTYKVKQIRLLITLHRCIKDSRFFFKWRFWILLELGILKRYNLVVKNSLRVQWDYHYGLMFCIWRNKL